MTRRNQKKVDYSKSSNDDSQSDDDFQVSPSPPIKKARTSKVTKKDAKKEKEKPIQENVVKRRNTRTSKVDEIFEKDLQEAIKASSANENEQANSSFTDNKRLKNPKKVKKKKIVHVISDEENDEDDEDEYYKDTEKDFATMDTLIVESSSISDTLDEKQNVSSSNALAVSSSVSDIPEKQQNNKCSSKLPAKESSNKEVKIETSKRKTIASKTNQKSPLSNIPSKYQKENGSKEVIRTPKIAPSLTNTLIRQITPGRLRLGLSRNIRVSKSLHPHVSPNIGIT